MAEISEKFLEDILIKKSNEVQEMPLMEEHINSIKEMQNNLKDDNEENKIESNEENQNLEQAIITREKVHLAAELEVTEKPPVEGITKESMNPEV